MRARISCVAAVLALGAARAGALEGVDLGAASGFDVRVLLASPPRGLEGSLVPPLRLDHGAGGAAKATTPRGSDRRRYIGPVLLSAVVPGAGEIATGHWMRGLPLLAADVATWIGKAHFEAEGRDWRDRYQTFADTHWRYTGDRNGNGFIDVGFETPGWQENLELYFDSSQADPGLRWWNPEAPYNCNCPYIPKEEDPQHYYENIGKYRYYWMGWEDWAYNAASPRDSDSAMRRQYGDMRIESNDNFDNANALVAVAMVNRLVSAVQSVFLVRGDLRRERLTVVPMKVSGLGAGLAMKLRY